MQTRSHTGNTVQKIGKASWGESSIAKFLSKSVNTKAHKPAVTLSSLQNQLRSHAQICIQGTKYSQECKATPELTLWQFPVPQVGGIPPLLCPKSLTTSKQNPIWLAIPNITLTASIALLTVWKVLTKSLLKSRIGKKKPFQNFLGIWIGIHTPAVCNSQEKLKTRKLKRSSTENQILLQLHFLVYVKLDYDWHSPKQAVIPSQD